VLHIHIYTVYIYIYIIYQILSENFLGIPCKNPGSATREEAGHPADPVAASTNGSSARGRGGGGASAAGEAEKEDLVLQDTFAQETAVTIEDPNMYLLCFSCVCHFLMQESTKLNACWLKVEVCGDRVGEEDGQGD
jgi:hypothetical protein